MAAQLFSDELEAWARSDKPKTLAGINEVFGTKSFAIIFLILLSLSATPIPTGGITNILEIMAMLFTLELIIGRKSLWLPKKWQHAKLSKSAEEKFIPFILKRVRWFEKYSKPSRHNLLVNRSVLRLCGFVILLFTIGAFVAPPFSGLDTLPSLGVVTISLALLFNDIRLFVIGIIAGLIGMGIIASLGGLIVESLNRIF
jgi:hypothetical protein